MASETLLESKTPLQFVPGVGPQRAALFERLGVRRAMDLLFFFPRTYQDIAPWSSVLELVDGQRSTVLGHVVDRDYRLGFQGHSVVGILLALQGGGYLRCIWYNQPFRREQFAVGMRVLATGIVKSTGVAFQIRHPECTVLGDGEEPPMAKPLPIYPLTEGLQQRHVASAVAAVMPLVETVEEAIPASLRDRATKDLLTLAHQEKPTSPSESLQLEPLQLEPMQVEPLLPIREALRWLHQPSSLADAQRARSRFIFQELFVLQLALAMHRHRVRHTQPAPRIISTAQIHSRILKRFPFALTADQLRVIEDIRTDMALEVPMNRLVQGDVGSGKTAVAHYAMLNAVANRYQTALMAPTELLARQHYQKLVAQMSNSQVMIELLVGSIPARDRRELLQRIALGTVDIVVGTQALISEQVDFAKLGLLVIDEQHRFGVEQRAKLRDSRIAPHYLVMTATPIPRTLAMTVFGDLDVSTLRERPPGQSLVKTYVSDLENQDRWWRFVIEQVRSGRQAFVVAPRVETDEEDESLGAVQLFHTLTHGPLADLRVELVHGRMDGEDKQRRLEAFTKGETQVLVATTVIEVGIDVPNASVMTIMDADRMGLAQLHQLRGRVGRGRFPGFACLFPRKGIADEDRERLQQFANNHDGFALSELDLQLRGPGELLGTRQSGLPTLKIADLARDRAWVQVARNLAIEIIACDPNLDSPEHALLRRQVVAKHGAALAISDVG